MAHSLLFLGLATLFSGLSFFMVKIGAIRIHPLYANFAFGVVMFVIHGSVVWYWVRNKGLSLALSSSNVSMILLGGVVSALYGIFLFLAFQKLNVSNAAPVLYVGSLSIVLLLSIVVLKEPFTRTDIVGLILAFTSIILLAR